ncbi:CapA family protein [Bacillus sp. FJAT-52991]|uniref:CapA family protein n=1 Tax=Bacillus kandeliae TaxID=3129297 RepID=A0ABZ2NAM3_9BACI
MERRRKKRRRLKRPVRNVLIVLCVFIAALIVYNLTIKPDKSYTEETENKEKSDAVEVSKNEPVQTTIKISAAGDFTLGTDESFTYAGSFPDEAQKNGLPYFTAELGDVFKQDDLSTVNLEGPLTNATEKAVKKFRFKGDPSYVEILQLAGIESVNLANNHTFDYLQKGYDDTIATLKKNKIGYFGYENTYVTTVKGVKIGVLGYEGWDDTEETRAKVKAGIEEVKNQGAEIVLVHFHWGVERQYVPTSSQQTLAHFAIDNGADLILGHHPHVVQGIEEYKGKFIVYSLGNFMFGGNRNPSDKDTYVFQQTFHLTDGQLTDKKEIKVIPFSISSVPDRNNYQPKLLTGDEAVRVKNKIIDVSNQIQGSDWTKYEVQ